MRYCKDCWNFDRCNVERRTVEFAVDDGVCLNFEGKPMTNADRIRAMSDEELAKWALFKAIEIGREYSDSLLGLIKWLKQPAEEG